MPRSERRVGRCKAALRRRCERIVEERDTSAAERAIAEQVVGRIKGVKAVAQELQVRLAHNQKRDDDQIAAVRATVEQNLKDTRAEIRAQVERFFALVGRWPTHVDGHHHIHVHPLVAGQLAAILSRERGREEERESGERRGGGGADGRALCAPAACR